MNHYQTLIADLTPKYGAAEARSMARIVFEDAFGTRHPAALVLSGTEKERLQDILARLLQDEPVQYVVGKAQFFGQYFKVNPAVLIPRQETEELVALALDQIEFQLQLRERIRGTASPYKVLDIGTGSGCIAIALQQKMRDIQVYASDISEPALGLAKENARLHKSTVVFLQNDILNQATWDQFPIFDLIISNPPYIPMQEANLMPDNVKNHEPHVALFVPDETPLLFYETIAAFAQKMLAPDGHLLFECNAFNAKQVERYLAAQKFENLLLKRDLNGKERMIMARKRTKNDFN